MNRLIQGLLVSMLVFVCGCQDKQQRADAHVERGKALLAQGDVQASQIEFNNALAKQPDRVDALFGIAEGLEKQRKWQQLLKFLLRIVELDPAHTPARTKLGTVFLASNQIDKAQEQIAFLKSQAPDVPDTWILDANAHLVLANQTKALASINQALALDAKNADALWLLARVHMANGAFADALTSLDQGLAADPENVYFYATKVRALNAMEQQDKGVEVFQNLVQVDPKNPAFHRILAQQYLEAGKPDRASDTLLAFAQKYPSDASLSHAIEFYQAYRERSETEALIKRYIQTYPDQLMLKFALADFYLQTDALAQAKSVLLDAEQAASDESDKVKVRNQLALFALAQGQHEEALSISKTILELDPQNTRAITTQARVALEQKETERAIRLLRSALHNNGQDAFVLYLLARAHEQQGMDDLARDHYQRALPLSGFNGAIALEYVHFLVNSGRFEQAEDLLAKTPLAEPYVADLLTETAKVKLALGKWREAEAVARKLQTKSENASTSNQLLGLAYSGMDQSEKSMAAFKKAHQSAPDEFRPLASFVQAALRANEAGRARAFLQKLLQEEPNNANALLLLSRVDEATNDLEQAETHLLKAASIKPPRVDAYYALYQFYRVHDRAPKAKAVLVRAVEQMPDNLDFVIRLANSYEAAGAYDDSKVLYEKWLERDPDTRIVRNNLASLLLQDENGPSHKRALDLVKALSDLAVPQFQDTLGWAYYRNGDMQAALRHLLKAKNDLSDVAEFNFHLGAVYLALGQHAEAGRYLQMARSKARKNALWVSELNAMLKELNA